MLHVKYVVIRRNNPAVLGDQAATEGLLQVQPQEQPQEGLRAQGLRPTEGGQGGAQARFQGGQGKTSIEESSVMRGEVGRLPILAF